MAIRFACIPFISKAGLDGVSFRHLNLVLPLRSAIPYADVCQSAASNVLSDMSPVTLTFHIVLLEYDDDVNSKASRLLRTPSSCLSNNAMRSIVAQFRQQDSTL